MCSSSNGTEVRNGSKIIAVSIRAEPRDCSSILLPGKIDKGNLTEEGKAGKWAKVYQFSLSEVAPEIHNECFELEVDAR